MKTRLFAALVLAGLTAVFTQAAESPAKLKVLVITGGHGFAREPFFQVFSGNPEIAFTEARHTTNSAFAYDRDDLLSYDVVVLYDMVQNITDAQKSK